MSLVFSTKAGTLLALQGLVRTARILPLIKFTVGEWQKSRSNCIGAIDEILGAGPWIVRSSCQREDSVTSSNAGAFLSILDVSEIALEAAIEKVIASYGETKFSDEVLIQPMLAQAIRSGVAFSHDVNTCSPYRIVNWSEGDNTQAVTGGFGGRVWQQSAGFPVESDRVLPAVKPILLLVEELLSLFSNIPLDCEFAVTRDDDSEVLWLLQVRPLILMELPETDSVQASRIKEVERKVCRGFEPHPSLMGTKSAFGVMPDWNPAEIIGIRPRPLALSLYRELVTDSVWAYQRHNYGYRNLRSFPLMPHFFGLPYIDIRLSFNSFIPEDLDAALASRLVDHYVNRLIEEPALHDKVEFEVVFSCYTFDLPDRMIRLSKDGFTRRERESICSSLRNLTNRILDSGEGPWRVDASKIDLLNARREKLSRSRVDHLEHIYWLIEDCKRYGTLPFAGLARAGFMAVQLLQSLLSIGILSQSDYDSFFSGLSTVSGHLARDRAIMDKTTFLSCYGHLRPGTYDILSPRYDEEPDLYFDWNDSLPVPETEKPFELTSTQNKEINELLKHHDLRVDANELFEFIKSGIELRELSKFHFTKNLSDALGIITTYGELNGFSRNDLAYSDISVFRELHIAAAKPKEMLSCSIELGKKNYDETRKLSLPPLIIDHKDVWAWEWPEATPNFITQKQVTAPVVQCDLRESLAGSIVCVPNADPGFDWLFAYPIVGLITAWGGANSHMAIRAGELGLPAVIGAGEVFYRRWSAAKRLHLDCAGRRVEVLG